MIAIFKPAGVFALLILMLTTEHLNAQELRIAVASNFLLPLKYIAREYQQETGDKLIISTGSTGKLYAQIVNGAPFDIFLAANSREPERLEKEGYALIGSRFTYARGRLALWDPKGRHNQSTLEEVLKAKDYKRLSMANPLTAPYGAAALSVIQKLNLDKNNKVKILRGENVSQAYQYVATSAADLGFISLSQIKASEVKQRGTYWIADESMHTPILQQAVILNSTHQKIRSKSFLSYLKSNKAQAMIENFGYGLF